MGGIKLAQGICEDLSGKVYGRLTAIKRAPNQKSGTAWLVQCSCGNTKEVLAHSLKHGYTTSCGCFQKECVSKVSKGKPGTALRNLLHTYKSNAKAFNREFSLSEELFRRLTSSPCFYCGDPPNKKISSIAGEIYTYTGVDRKDSDLGYTEENCVSCCYICNFMK